MSEPITCDRVRQLVESAGKAWAIVIAGTSSDLDDATATTLFMTWGKSPADKVFASGLSEHIGNDLCPGPAVTLESFHGKEEAARNKAEVERLRQDHHSLCHEVAEATEIIRDLRRKLAEAGVEGSPPPGRQGTIPELLGRVREAEATNEAMAGELHVLRLENTAPRERFRETLNEEFGREMAGMSAEVARLIPFEQAMRAMAAQFVHPKVTAEEMVEWTLKEDKSDAR